MFIEAEKERKKITNCAQINITGCTLFNQDRVIFHRLERICYTIERGKWPSGPYMHMTPYDSHSATPVGSSTPRPDSASESGDPAELNQVMNPLGGEQGEKDFEVHLSQVGQALGFAADACLCACLTLVLPTACLVSRPVLLLLVTVLVGFCHC